MRELTFLPQRSIAFEAAAALLAGAVYSLGFAPWSFNWLGLIGLGAGLGLAAHAASAGRAGLAGFSFAFAAFLPGLSWTVRSINEFGRIPLAAAWMAAALLAAVCALFWAAAAAAAAKLTPQFEEHRVSVLRWYALALMIALAEWLRGARGVDFGWLTPALGVLDTPFSGLAPLGGTHLMNLCVLLALASLGAALSGLRQKQFAALWVLLIPVLVAAAAVFGLEKNWSTPAGSVSLRLIQADLPVVDGWTRPDSAARLDRASSMMAGAWTVESRAAATLTPEGILSADTLRANARIQDALTRFLAAADGPVLFNGFRRVRADKLEWFNSGFFVDASGRTAITDKRKLVPFGEYVPYGLGWFVRLLGIPLSDLSPGKPEQPNLDVSGVRAGLLICYENIDGEVLRTFWRDPKGAPGIFFVTANLGWFHPFVIEQHLDMTRLLSMASSRPAASVNMNGRSAFIDESGCIRAEAAPSGPAVLSGTIETRSGPPTPYVLYGDLPAMLLWSVFFVLLLGVRLLFTSKRSD